MSLAAKSHAAVAQALKMARDTFVEYQRSHMAKNPPDSGKAMRNQDMALLMDRAIAVHARSAPEEPT